jgi:hypothetical protein
MQCHEFHSGKREGQLMIKRIIHYCVGIALIFIFGGCATGNLVNLSNVTDEALDEMVFPAPTDGMKILRSKYILAAIALYGQHSVREYSGERVEGDATTILSRLKSVNKKLGDMLKENCIKVGSPNCLPNFVRLEYTRAAVSLLDAAVEPTKRYYRERILSHIASQNPVAIASTAKQALEGILKVTAYKKAITQDARDHFVTIVSTATKKTVDRGKLWDDAINSIDAKAATGVAVLEEKNNWYDALPKDLLKKMKENSEKLNEWEKDRIRSAMKLGSIKTTPKIKITDDQWKKAWKDAGKILEIGCKKLQKLADLDAVIIDCDNL